MTETFLRIQVPDHRPITVVLDRTLIVGRDCDGLILADRQASRRHTSFEPVDGRVRVVDLDSSNGTFVNGRQITGPTMIEPGDHVLVGRTRIDLRITRARHDSAPDATEIVARAATEVTSSIERVADGLDDHWLKPHVVGAEDEAGTLTIVFSDIERSTELAVALGDVAWSDVMQRHQELFEAHTAAHRGRIVKNQGDGYMLCFRSARQALLASIGLQRDLELHRHDRDAAPVHVRIGAHTGEVLLRDDGDLLGKHVIVAARIGEAAAGRQILVSSLTKQIAEPRGDLGFGSAQRVQLKGIDGPTTVFDVDWAGYGDRG